MSITTRRFSLLITGDLLGDTLPRTLAEHLAGTNAPESDGVLIPGCPILQNVTVTPSEEKDEVAVSAEILAYDTIPTGDYKGDEVTESFIADYIAGAGEYWCSGGDMLFPTTVTVIRV